MAKICELLGVEPDQEFRFHHGKEKYRITDGGTRMEVSGPFGGWLPVGGANELIGAINGDIPIMEVKKDAGDL